MNTETLNKLKAPLPYQWRVQSIKEYGCDCVAYIDSRDVQERLDEVVGVGGWQSDYKEVKGVVYGGIGIKVGEEWIWKWDAGSESNIEKEKGEASDSFKRAAVKWGIGRFLYDLKVVKLKSIQYEKNKKWYPLNETTGKPLFDGVALTNYINSLNGKQPKAQAKQPVNSEVPTPGEKQDLCNLIETTTLNPATRKAVFEKIVACQDYKAYNDIKFYLEDHQKESLNQSQKEISKTVSKKVNATA
jgi:hypothetical protein